jgi:hypothetical protein
MSEVFVSYSSADRERVEPLVRLIEEEGFDLWWDRDIDHGQNFHRVIEDALKQAKCAVVVWSENSIGSEWVVNEASLARKRGVLVPVCLDNVEPPLEFRHIQTAKLWAWKQDPDDPEFRRLLDAIATTAGHRRDRVKPGKTAGSKAAPRKWWETPAGLGVAIAALLLASSVFLAVAKYVGLIGSSPAVADVSQAATRGETLAETVKPEPGTPAAQLDQPVGTSPIPAPSSQTETGNINLLDPEQGATLLIASEENWRSLIGKQPTYTIISTHGFAVFGFKNGQAASFNKFGVYVESADSSNVKELALYHGNEAETGPFQKIGQFTVPNYRNMRSPFHEFEFDPVTARYVKVEVVSWQGGDWPNGNVGTIQLYGQLQ